MTATPITLIHRLQREPTAASWTRFVELFAPVLYAYASKRQVPAADADDLIQDVFLVVLDRLADFQHNPELSFRSWLCTILLNKLRDRKRRTTLAGGEYLSDVRASEPDPAEFMEAEEYERLLVNRALEIMKSEFQPLTWRACWEHVTNGRKADQVALELGISVNAVYLNSSRVIRRLRMEMRGLLD